MTNGGPAPAGDGLAGSLVEPAQTRPPLAAKGERVAFIDNARAIGIVLVVAGHAPALPSMVGDFIFAFHMPLFFLLSGLMVGAERLHMATARRARLLATSLLAPYVTYFAISFVYWLVAKRHGLRAAEFEALPWWDPLVGFVCGGGDHLYINVVLWFLPCLYLVSLAHHALSKAVPRAGVTVLSGIAAVVFVLASAATPLPKRWPWSADCAVVGLFFFSIGALCNPLLARRRPPPHRALLVLGAIVGLGACLALADVTGRVDLNHLQFGEVPVLYLPMGIAGAIGALAAAALLPRSRVAHWLSINTLVVFPMHFLIFSAVTGFAVLGLDYAPGFKESSPYIALIYTVIALLLSWPLSLVLKRFFPWLHGARPRSAVPLPSPS